METYSHWTGIKPEDRGASAAIGNFDGVHRGHQAVLDIARAYATDKACKLGVVTFDPHPREFFAPDAPPFRLMNPEAKSNRLAKLGVDVLYQLPFDKVMVGFTPEDFARTVICEGLGLRHVVVGEDFCFGKGRQGSAQDLVTFGAAMGFDVTLVPLLNTGDSAISSTAIRTALGAGRPQDAADMLGHLHRIEGEVLHGDKRGRDLGFPTANMAISGMHPPRFGVYAVKVDVLTGPHKGSYHGAASVGVRPMFGVNTPNCETYLFDFKGDLYGEHISVALVEFLRPEVKFDSIEALITQMNADCDKARDILNG